MRVLRTTILVFGGITLILSSRLEPSPGRSAILMGVFSGDWSLRIGETGYEIGRAADGRIDRYDVWRWVEVPGFTVNAKSNNLNTLVESENIREVIEYNSGDKWIVIRTDYGYTWIDTLTHNRFQARSTPELREQAPSDVARLLRGLHAPRPSRRGLFIAVGTILIVWAAASSLRFVLFCKKQEEAV